MMNFSNEQIDLNFDPSGVYGLKIGGFDFAGCKAKVVVDGIDDTPKDWKVVEAKDDSLVFAGQGNFGNWTLKFESDENDLSINISGELSKKCREIRLSPFCVNDLDIEHILAQGVKMGGCSSILPRTSEDRTFQGYYQMMFSSGNGYLRMSWPMKQKQPALFCGEIKNGKVVDFDAGTDILHFDGTLISTESLTLKNGTCGFSLLSEYADENIEEVKDFSDGLEPGWNSWDYYRWTITEEEVLENAEFIARDPVLSKHVKRIIVDDGWQYCYGEWEPNHLFPNGMKYLADELTKMGFEPGLWFAPTIVEPHCRIAQMDYDMLARGESDKPCLGFRCMARYGFLLDPTQEKVQKHLYDMFARYADMGYKYFKLDFMGMTLNARKFADATVPRSRIQELIVKPIHEAVNGKASILGCNYHFEGGTKLVDSVRIGSDIHATWNSIKHNTVSVAARFWSNNKLWVNDPDFALCRAFDTSNDPDITRLLPSLIGITPELEDAGVHTTPLVDIKRPQAEILLSIVIAAGGAVNLSDKMTRLNESGVELARKVVSAERGDAAIPLDLFKSELPSCWLQKVGNYWRVLLINWTDETAFAAFDPAEHGINALRARDFWNDKYITLQNNKLSLELAPRSCVFAELR
jgi:hypothetical protein